MICANYTLQLASSTLTWSFPPFQQVKGTSRSTPLSRHSHLALLLLLLCTLLFVLITLLPQYAQAANNA